MLQKTQALSRVLWKTCYKADVWAKVPVYRELLLLWAGKRGFQIQTKIHSCPWVTQDSFKGKKGPAYQVLATATGSKRSEMLTMASVTAHLHFVGGAHGVGHLEKHPGSWSTERW